MAIKHKKHHTTKKIWKFLRNLSYHITLLIKIPELIIRGSTVSASTRVKLNTVIVRSKIGQYNYIGEGSYLVDTITGNYCSIASGVKIGGMEHQWWSASTSLHLSECNSPHKPTIIEDDVWIGVNAIVRQGITIGRGVVIGAGSIVLHDIPAFSIVAGAPSRHIRMRFNDDTIKQINQSQYWVFNPDEAKKKLLAIDIPERTDLAPQNP